MRANYRIKIEGEQAGFTPKYTETRYPKTDGAKVFKQVKKGLEAQYGANNVIQSVGGEFTTLTVE